jgi:hypothetical protein
MKKTGFLLITAAGLLFFCCNKAVTNENGTDAQVVDYTDLATGFKSPDALYGTDCWWWWLNGNVTKEAITKDLEAMKSRNFYGAMIFDAGGHNQRGNKDIPAGPLFGSEEWIDLFVFALDEAKRLGLEIGFNIQSGWNLGGPRVTPQYAAKQLTYSETKITGGSAVNVSLETPRTHNSFYKDVAVLALPLKFLPEAGLVGSAYLRKKDCRSRVFYNDRAALERRTVARPEVILRSRGLRRNEPPVFSHVHLLSPRNGLAGTGIFRRYARQSAGYVVERVRGLH